MPKLSDRKLKVLAACDAALETVKQMQLYTCACCLRPFRDNPATVLDDGAELRCPQCSKESDEQEMERRRKQDAR